jgi:ssDNA-binding Zn-finger/Zn-ribbon topoisomerase 1
MIFSKKKKTVLAFSVEKCNNCKKETRREFKEGDMLFAAGSNCPSCSFLMSISKIFGESKE